MTAPLLPIHEGIPPCHRDSRDQALLVSSLHRTDKLRPKKRTLSEVAACPETAKVLTLLQQKNRRNVKRKLNTTETRPVKIMRKKRAHFEVNSNNEIIPHIQNPSEELVLTAEEIKAMWWRDEETMHFKRRAKRDSHAYQAADSKDSADSSYIKKFKEALKVCSNSSGHLENIPLVSNTKIRGLEMYMFPEALVRQRQRVIRAVLKYQAQIPKSMNPDHKARLLNAASKGLTRPYRRLSRLLAIGDARVVAQLDQEDYHDDDFHQKQR